ncbi:2-methoxy-6-polyprenyl-1,4-benzoquinol methylase, mitochondrial [Osmia bicornis bicornis]|uniref:2-methoxy-6-polyprenyl-1,4-benzoquinol methylase, mitochondrial n=1 Tax=Osmia bicornis bicornis TaxID=1437191 RepID=UPI0010F66D2D|nr:2-methoxy-6-polyprenyl-1,4-benzoquinol methylase, mitochondrial [Osmia bicornis bicornis]XP_046145008.1 2-methoxy-6-polyprenyl-1,4-benzoquinol methylase, mitochondrial [Osmia bicornis bicornis]
MIIRRRFLSNLMRNRKTIFLFEKYFSEATTVNDNEKTTHFGFKTVKEADKMKEVYTVFEKVADSYDQMNDAMSLGIHRIWKDIFIQKLGPTHGSKLLDSAGGTGDITFRYLNYLKNSPNPQNLKSSVTVCDINENMLKVGKVRAEKQGWIGQDNIEIDWKQCDAEKLPFNSDVYTAYTIAFGIRNVTHIDKVLSEAYRVLTPGGRFMCLEFSHVNNNLLRWIYDQYSFQIIPVLGTLIAGEWQAYQYLVESIRKFPKQEDFKEMIEEAGFRNVTYQNLTSGVVAIHSGFKL